MLREILAKIEFGQRRFETRHVLDHPYGEVQAKSQDLGWYSTVSLTTNLLFSSKRIIELWKEV